jgi:hypothetical protein
MRESVSCSIEILHNIIRFLKCCLISNKTVFFRNEYLYIVYFSFYLAIQHTYLYEVIEQLMAYINEGNLIELIFSLLALPFVT